MALYSERNKPVEENSFHNFMESTDGKLRPGVLVKVVGGYNFKHGTIGMLLKARQLGGDPKLALEYLVLIGEKQWYFDAYEIEVL